MDIFETEKALTLLADMPGIQAKDLSIDLREGVLALSTHVPLEGASEEMDLLREYQTGNYYRKFNLSDIIDQSRIEAKLTDGVFEVNAAQN